MIVSQDTGAAQGSSDIAKDPYEQFLAKGREIWDKLEADEERSHGDKAKRGWELIDVVEDENSPSTLCYTSGACWLRLFYPPPLRC